MQCFKCQAHCHIAANCDNAQRLQDAMETITSKTNQNEPRCANCNEKHRAAYKGCQT